MKKKSPKYSFEFFLCEGMEGRFIGHLASEPEACIAMVNHPEHAELTILTKRVVGSTMYKWHKSGNVELIPDEDFSNGLEDAGEGLEGGESDEDFEDQEESNEEELEIQNSMTDDQTSSIPKTAKLEVRVGKGILFVKS